MKNLVMEKCWVPCEESDCGELLGSMRRMWLRGIVGLWREVNRPGPRLGGEGSHQELIRISSLIGGTDRLYTIDSHTTIDTIYYGL